MIRNVENSSFNIYSIFNFQQCVFYTNQHNSTPDGNVRSKKEPQLIWKRRKITAQYFIFIFLNKSGKIQSCLSYIAILTCVKNSC